MKTLHLTLKRKWFDLILSGIKNEEYRDINKYWVSRLCDTFEYANGDNPYRFYPKPFNAIKFKNGYQKNARKMTVELLGIDIGKPKKKWSDNSSDLCFVLKLGKILNK